MLPDFRLYYKTIVIKNSIVEAQKQTHWSMEQTREPKYNSQNYGQLIGDKGGKNIQQRKDSLFNKSFWEYWTATCERMKIEH